jgi:DNA-binding ferritin-like protein
MLDLLNQVFQVATEENQQGIANFIAERIDAHQKHGWMLRSYLKEERA